VSTFDQVLHALRSITIQYAGVTIQKGDYEDFCLLDDLRGHMDKLPKAVPHYIEVNVSQVPADELDGFYGVLCDADYDWEELDPSCPIRIWSTP
jgi:hypothetical protein